MPRGDQGPSCCMRRSYRILHPLPLDVLLRDDHQRAEVGLKVAKEGECAGRHIGLSHAYFVGQVRDALPLGYVVDCSCTLKLLLGARAQGRYGRRSRALAGRRDVDHGVSVTTGAARLRTTYRTSSEW